jgi:hypothetical protein
MNLNMIMKRGKEINLPSLSHDVVDPTENQTWDTEATEMGRHT